MSGPLFEFVDMTDPYKKRIRLKETIENIQSYKSITFTVEVSDCYQIHQKHCTALKSDPIGFRVMINDVNDFAPEIIAMEENPKIEENLGDFFKPKNFFTPKRFSHSKKHFLHQKDFLTPNNICYVKKLFLFQKTFFTPKSFFYSRKHFLRQKAF